MIITATATTSACGIAGAGPQMSQPMNASAAMAMTPGTNQAATRSARRWMAGWLRCAADTNVTICASSVSFPTLSARTKVTLRSWRAAAGSTRSSPIPQMGQAPTPVIRTCGCIGQL